MIIEYLICTLIIYVCLPVFRKMCIGSLLISISIRIMKSKITIITVIYNVEDIIVEMINSIINQTYQNIEWINIDGGSKDKTLQILQRYENNISVLVSEPDKGIFDAMNKGLDLATGEWVNFMNAGDKFSKNTILSEIDFEFYMKESIGVIYGNTLRAGKKISYPQPLKNINTGGMPACHQSMFFNIKLLSNDLKFKNEYLSLNRYGDVELIARLYKQGVGFKYIDQIISNNSEAGSSSTGSLKTSYLKYKWILKYFGFLNLIQALLSWLTSGNSELTKEDK